MGRRFIKRIISLTIISVTLVATMPISVSAEWRQNNLGYLWQTGGTYAKGWKSIDGKWYYFNSNGNMIHNAVIDNYYINSSGEGFALVSGNLPIKIPSNWVKMNDTFYTVGNTPILYIVENTYGRAEKDILNEFKMGIVKESSQLKTSQKNFNGFNAICLEYLMQFNSEIRKAYTVVFFNNDRVYSFTIASRTGDYDYDKQQIEDLLNLTLVL